MSSFTNRINYSLNITGGNLNVDGSSTLGNLYTSSATASQLVATNVSAGTLSGESATLSGNLNSASATVPQFVATNVSAGTFVGESASLTGNLNSASATVPQFVATNVSAGTLTAETAKLSGNLTVSGDLIVSGTTTTVNTETTTIEDNLLVLNSGPLPSADAGILMKRFVTGVTGPSNYAGMFYKETTDEMTFALTDSDPGASPVIVNSYLPIRAQSLTLETSGSLIASGSSNRLGALITTGANVGIGTSRPRTALDVNGDLSVIGNILLENSNFIGIPGTSQVCNVESIAFIGQMIPNLTDFGSFFAFNSFDFIASFTKSNSDFVVGDRDYNSVSEFYYGSNAFDPAFNYMGNVQKVFYVRFTGTVTGVTIPEPQEEYEGDEWGPWGPEGPEGPGGMMNPRILFKKNFLDEQNFVGENELLTIDVTTTSFEFDSGVITVTLKTGESVQAIFPQGTEVFVNDFILGISTNPEDLDYDIDDIIISSVPVPKISFPTNGNVGINTTSPAYNLDVTSTSNFNGIRVSGTINPTLAILGSNTTGSFSTITQKTGVSADKALQFWNQSPNATSNDMIFRFLSPSVSDILTITGAGNVGIGTTSPSSKLEINGGNISLPSLSILSSGTDSTISIKNTGSGGRDYWIGSGSSGAGGGSGNFYVYDRTATTVRMVINQSGNVGIGTSSPSSRFHVYDNINSGLEIFYENANTGSSAFSAIRLKSNTTNSAYIFLNSTAKTNDGPGSCLTVRNDAGDLRLQSTGGNGIFIRSTSGNVGIGTSSPNAALQLGNVVSNRRIVLWEEGNNDHQFFGLGINGGIIRYQVASTGNDHVFYAGVNSTTSNELMRISGNGNVGIGTSSPRTKFDVYGASVSASLNTIGEGGTASLFFGTPLFIGSAMKAAIIARGKTSWSRSMLHFCLDDTANNDIAFNASLSNTRMVIDSNGNVGIGTTNPTSVLTVLGSGSGGTIRVYPTTNGGESSIGFYSSQTTGNYWVMGQNSWGVGGNLGIGYQGTGNIMTISTTGNIGIGTSSPNAALQLGNVASNRRIVLFEGSNNDHAFFGFGINTSLLRYQVAGTDNHHVFYAGVNSTTSNELMRISGNGNVGIGTTAPISKLDVRGNLSVSDNIVVESSHYIGISSTSEIYSPSYIGFTTGLQPNPSLFFVLTNPVVTNPFFGLESGDLRYVSSMSKTLYLRFTGTFSGFVPGTIFRIRHLLSTIGQVALYFQTLTSSFDSGILTVNFTQDTMNGIDFSVNQNIDNIVCNNFTMYVSENINDLTTMVNATTITPSVGFGTSGNIGIGTSSPNSRLSITGSNNTGILKIANDTNAGGDSWWLGFNHNNTSADSTDRARIGVNIVSGGAGRLFFTTGEAGNQSEKMRIDENGNVGIGTSSPSTGFGGAISNVKLALLNGTPGSTGGTSTILIGGDANHYSSITASHTGGGNTFLTFGTATGATNPSEKMRITNAGNVGIGTSSPAATLDINGNLRARSGVIADYSSGYNSPGGNFNIIKNGAGNANIDLRGNDLVLNGSSVSTPSPFTVSNRLIASGNSNTIGNIITTGENVGIGTISPTFTLDVNGTFEAANTNGSLIFASSGNVGVGTTTPGYKLVVSGDIYATGDIIAYSDERLKSNVSTLTDALSKVNQMRGVSYTLTKTGQKSIGLIAQEVQKILPEIVAEKEEYLGVAYGNIVGLLVEAIKELNEKVRSLEDKLNE